MSYPLYPADPDRDPAEPFRKLDTAPTTTVTTTVDPAPDTWDDLVDSRPPITAEALTERQREAFGGPKEALAIAEIAGSRFTWAGLPPVDPGEPFACEVQIRAHADPVPAVARVATDAAGSAELVITPEQPLGGVAPGQTAVVYVGTRVLGQCTIDRTVSAVPAGA